MNRATKVISALLALAVLGSGAALLLKPEAVDHPVARISLDGEILNEIDLDAVTEAFSFVVEGSGGLTNTILMEPGRIRVSEADCPDQICVNQGFIEDGTAPIVCLPNKLMIEIVGGGDGLDAAAG